MVKEKIGEENKLAAWIYFLKRAERFSNRTIRGLSRFILYSLIFFNFVLTLFICAYVVHPSITLILIKNIGFWFGLLLGMIVLFAIFGVISNLSKNLNIQKYNKLKGWELKNGKIKSTKTARIKKR